MQRIQKNFELWLKTERSRLFLWLPVFLGAGMAIYYSLPFEPSAALYTSPVLLALFLAFRTKFPSLLSFILLALLLTANGAAYAKWRTERMDVRMLSAPLPMRTMEGTVSAVEHIEKGLRITLRAVAIQGENPATAPDSIRVSYRGKTLPDLTIGERVSLRAALLPPSGPVMPGGFDFSRYFFFRKIGAVGYAIPPITTLSPSTENGLLLRITEARDHLTAQIQKTLPGVNGTIASGLITGDDSAIPDEVHDQLRAANLLHIIAISGAHMVVIGGIVFVGLRALLTFIPGFGLRPIVKSITAFLTLIAITGYLAITGFEISAVRSYVMLALVLIAILFHREPQPMRSIALTALLMILYDPSDVIEPGFQLSFAATLALIAAFENVFDDHLQERGRIAKIWRVVWFLLLTTLIAQAATTSIILFHFNNLSLYGVVSNLVLTPVVTFIIMPMVALYFLLLPFGWQDLALHIMSYGIDAMLYVARVVSTWPHALTYTRGVTDLGIAIAMFGLCWICLWRTPIRRYGIIAVLIGTASLFTVKNPELFISPRAAQVAMHTDKGYVVLRGKADGLFPTLWANGIGQKDFPEYRSAQPLKEATCGKGFCDVTKQDTHLHFSFTVPDIKLGCPKTGWWISGYYFFPEERAECVGGIQFLDRSDFDKNGSYWGWFTQAGLELHNTRELAGNRIWSAKTIPSLIPRHGSAHAGKTHEAKPHKQSKSKKAPHSKTGKSTPDKTL